MEKFIRIGVDLAKNYFQVHALTGEDRPAMTRKHTRLKMRQFFSGIDPCLVGMEACGSAHYWARELLAMGHDLCKSGIPDLLVVRLIPPIYVKLYVKRGPRMTRPTRRQSARPWHAPACGSCRSRARKAKRR